MARRQPTRRSEEGRSARAACAPLRLPAAFAIAALAAAGAHAQSLDRPNDFGLRGSSTFPGRVSQPPPRPATGTAGSDTPGADQTINYGRPRAKHPPPKSIPRTAPRNPLPPLVPYRSSQQGRDERKPHPVIPPVYNPDASPPTIAPPPTVAVVPTIPVKARPRADNDPFAPVGIGIGNLRLTPFVESGIGFDSNPNRVQTPLRNSAFWRGDAGLGIQSDWSQHSVNGALRLGYSDFFSVPSANRPDGAGSVGARIDVTRDTSIDLGGTFALDTLRAGSPDLIGLNNSIATNRPVIWTIGGFVGATQRFNRLELSLRGIVDRSQYGNATYSDGSTVYLSRNDYTTLGIRPRISYELTPGFRPFVEATIDKRDYDKIYDVNGYRRSSTGVTVRGGAAFEVTPLLKGEASGGFTERHYDDPRLATLRGPVIDAALIWTATPLTTVTLRGTTNVVETTIAGVSGALTRTVSGQVSHALLRNLTITGTTAYTWTDYTGVDYATSPSGTINEQYLTAGVKAEYNLTRTVVIKASYNYQRLRSTVTGSDYTANVFLLGLRLQQ